jgi:hypothetical protein
MGCWALGNARDGAFVLMLVLQLSILHFYLVDVRVLLALQGNFPVLVIILRLWVLITL